MERIPIVLHDMPGILREIVRNVVRTEPDMTIVGDVPAYSDLVAAVGSTGARFVVTDARTADYERISRLLGAHPEVRVLGIADDGRQSFLYELTRRRLPLGEVSPRMLTDTIRGRVAATDEG